jgi:hypothetical protein
MNSIAQLKYNIRSIKCHDSWEPCLIFYFFGLNFAPWKVTKRDSMQSVTKGTQRAFGGKKKAQKSPYFEGKKKVINCHI